MALDLIEREDDQIFQLIRETGLGTNLTASGFGQATFAQVCWTTAELAAEKATPAQRSLLKMFDREELAGQIELVVRALLEPWVSVKPEPEHRKAISEFLLNQVGDPIAPTFQDRDNC